MVYTVKKLAKLAGVSVRTLHLYDEMDLLKPAAKTDAGYRLYGEKELLRLQQILFYKELDMPLRSIADLLDDDDFDTIEALQNHIKFLLEKKERINSMLKTVDKTIQFIKGETKMKHQELYEGFSSGKAETFRNEAIDKWAKDTVIHAEKSLLKLSREDIRSLKSEQDQVIKRLESLAIKDPESKDAQDLITEHYRITRRFWGTSAKKDPQAEAYSGLGRLFAEDNRYLASNGITDPETIRFISEAMIYFAGKLQKA
jgi:DNA-binding transcriptional MerR regulator